MASDVTNSLLRTQLAGRLEGTKKVSPAHGEGSNLAANVKGQIEQNGKRQTGSTTNEKVELDHAVADINQFVQRIQRELQFSITEDDTVIEVRDTETNEVVREIPSDDALKLAQKLHETMGVRGGIFTAQA